MYARVKPVLDTTVRALCRKSYPGHPKGCPNYDKKETCPPARPLLFDLIDETEPVYVIWTIFPFGAHVSKMKGVHPEWSDRQAKCCLYWQGTARKKLRQTVELFQCTYSDLRIIYIPEATGVNVTETMRSIGKELEWPPVNWTYQVALAGTTRKPTKHGE